MGDWGSGVPGGGDLNGNGKFDPGDMEMWHDINKNASKGGGSSGGGGYSGGGCGLWAWILILMVICACIEVFVGKGGGAILFFIVMYILWMMGKL